MSPNSQSYDVIVFLNNLVTRRARVFMKKVENYEDFDNENFLRRFCMSKDSFKVLREKIAPITAK
jgi:hypothetical protein